MYHVADFLLLLLYPALLTRKRWPYLLHLISSSTHALKGGAS